LALLLTRPRKIKIKTTLIRYFLNAPCSIDIVMDTGGTGQLPENAQKDIMHVS